MHQVLAEEKREQRGSKTQSRSSQTERKSDCDASSISRGGEQRLEAGGGGA